VPISPLNIAKTVGMREKGKKAKGRDFGGVQSAHRHIDKPLCLGYDPLKFPKACR
jgi:hypothetical protein